MSKRDDQVLRAADAKKPGYGKFLKALKEAKRLARKKQIVSPDVWEAIREVFGEEEPAAGKEPAAEEPAEEEPVTETLQATTTPGEHEKVLRQSGRDPRGTPHSKLSPPQ